MGSIEEEWISLPQPLAPFFLDDGLPLDDNTHPSVGKNSMAGWVQVN